jgi:hypothetical protein
MGHFPISALTRHVDYFRVRRDTTQNPDQPLLVVSAIACFRKLEHPPSLLGPQSVGRWDENVGDKTEQQSVVSSHKVSRCLGACNDD